MQSHWRRKWKPEAALKYAVSVASANALSPHTGRFDPKDRDEIIENVEIIKLSIEKDMVMLVTSKRNYC